MLKGKRLYYTNLFSPNEYEKNNKNTEIVLKAQKCLLWIDSKKREDEKKLSDLKKLSDTVDKDVLKKVRHHAKKQGLDNKNRRY